MSFGGRGVTGDIGGGGGTSGPFFVHCKQLRFLAGGSVLTVVGGGPSVIW